MMISTRGRYALRVMVDLAETGSDDYVAMRTIAQRQGISLKYLERILPVLAKNRLVEGVQGRGGGYRLCRRPEEYTVGEILRLAEGDLAPVSCLECGAVPCGNTEECRTRPLWKGLQAVIDNYLDSVTLLDLMRNEAEPCPAQAEQAQQP